MAKRRWDVPRAVRAAMVRTAKEERKKPTPSEKRLWQAVRRKALGVRFRRVQPIGPCRVDFLVASRRLIVEVDGSVHDTEHQQHADRERQGNLETLGFRFVRIRAEEVMSNLEGVLARLRREVDSPALSPPPPTRARR